MAHLTINRVADSGLFVVESIRQYKDTVQENIVKPEAEPGPEH